MYDEEEITIRNMVDADYHECSDNDYWEKKLMMKKKTHAHEERFELSKLEAPVLGTGPFDHSGTRALAEWTF